VVGVVVVGSVLVVLGVLGVVVGVVLGGLADDVLEGAEAGLDGLEGGSLRGRVLVGETVENACDGGRVLVTRDDTGGGGVVIADVGPAAEPSGVDCGPAAVLVVADGDSAAVPGAVDGGTTGCGAPPEPEVPGDTNPSAAAGGSGARSAMPGVSCARSPSAAPTVTAVTRNPAVAISIDGFPNRDLDRCRPAIAAPFSLPGLLVSSPARRGRERPPRYEWGGHDVTGEWSPTQINSRHGHLSGTTDSAPYRARPGSGLVRTTRRASTEVSASRPPRSASRATVAAESLPDSGQAHHPNVVVAVRRPPTARRPVHCPFPASPVDTV
jgi:hypothetical protein